LGKTIYYIAVRVICIFFIFAGISTQAQTNHWESVVYDSDSWKYHVGTTAPGAGWNQPGFDDTIWPQGQGGFGYGDFDDMTVIPTTLSVYIRINFDITDLTVIEEALLQADYDDAFIAYLNGQEIARSGFSGWTTEPSFNTPADQLHEASMYSGGIPESFKFDKSLLIQGSNVLAIQIHNQDLNSSDLTSRFFVHLGINNASSYYRSTPTWFVAPVPFQSSNLPLIFIETGGQNIPNDPRIIADMGIVNNGIGQRNALGDPFNEYSGKISIEIRGSSSQGFPKKNYRIETQDALGLNLNVPLLGMPAENDWVLHGPFSDKSLMRNVLTFHIGEKLGYYAPRTRFVELFLNNEYWGVYVLMETIKKDINRVDVATLNPIDVSGDQLTGGYIIKVDRADPEGGFWESGYSNNGSKHGYQIVYPKPTDVMPEQMNYIKNYVKDFETLLWDYKIDDPITGYSSMADEKSFIDFFLVNELSRNVDAYRLSSFLYKEKITDGGKLHAGPLWDFNLAYGNADYCEGWATSGWAYVGNCDGGVPFYWARLLSSKRFIEQLKLRWTALRQAELQIPLIHNYIDSVASVLDESQKRNFVKWPYLGKYVWPNSFVGNTYQEEVDYLKGWVEARFLALDYQIQNLEPVFDYKYLTNFETQIYPNPFVGNLNLQYALNRTGEVKISILNTLGQEVYFKDFGVQQSGVYDYEWDGFDKWGKDISRGMYFVMVSHLNDVKTIKRIIKR